MAIGDRVVVLKLGRVVGSIEADVLAASTTAHELQQLIVGLMFGEQDEPASDIAELREAGRVVAARASDIRAPVPRGHRRFRRGVPRAVRHRCGLAASARW